MIKEKNKYLDWSFKICLIAIIIALLIHNCTMIKNHNNEKIPTGNVNIIEIKCDKDDQCDTEPKNNNNENSGGKKNNNTKKNSTTTPASSTKKEIESLDFSEKNISIKNGDSLQLLVIVNPTELSSSKLTWKSDNPEVVTVDENGVITGLSVGKATITVTSENGKTTTCVINVVSNEIPVEKIIVTPNKTNMDVDSVLQLSVKIEPSNATNRDLIWTSSDESIATVDNKGIVKGLKAGKVTITAKTKDGKVLGTSEITVEEVFSNDLNVYDSDHKPVVWNGSTDLKIFTNSMYELTDVIAPEDSNTYQFVVKNGTDYQLKYNVKFIETNTYGINMKYKLKKNDTYLIDHYVKASELNIPEMLLNTNQNDTYYLEWKWISSSNDTEIGVMGNAKYGLKIDVKAESVDE